MPIKKFISYDCYEEYPLTEMVERSQKFYEELNRRRTVRQFSGRSVPSEIIENCISAAGTAPSGAHLQPWKFVIVGNPEIKTKIQAQAEAGEREFYSGKTTQNWVRDLEPLGTDDHKSFLTVAPWLIVVFAQKYGLDSIDATRKHYYVAESVGIASGILITALHHAGLASLTYTPSKSNFLNKLLERPENERPFMIVATGFPAEDAKIPDLERKLLSEISEFI